MKTTFKIRDKERTIWFEVRDDENITLSILPNGANDIIILYEEKPIIAVIKSLCHHKNYNDENSMNNAKLELIELLVCIGVY